MSLMPVCVFGMVICAALFIRRRQENVGISSLRSLIAPETEEVRAMLLEQAREEEKSVATQLPFLGRLEAEAKKAGMTITGRSLVFVAVLAGALAFTLTLALIGNLALALLASGVGLFAPRFWLSAQKRKRAATISVQLDGALAVMASALRGGSSLAQAISQAAQSVPEPLGLEFRRADRAVQTGMSPADALAVLKERIDSPDIDLMVITTQILARTGGNLAEIYDRLAETVRERRAFKQAVKASTAQARMSGMLISFMPVAITLLVRMVNPHYFDPMLASAVGKLLFLGSFGLIALGWVIIQRMLDVVTD